MGCPKGFLKKMKRKVAQVRLSPNEEARLLREEHERRRKLRIQQVREQQRDIALQIRRAVEQRRQRELQQLGEELRESWERRQRDKLRSLQKLYQESLQLLGQGHRSAKENEPDMAAIAQREEENHTKAEERYRGALRELKSQRLKDHEKQSRSINARKKALQAEKERSAKVASLPPPPPNPIQQSIDAKKPHVVRKSDVSAFAATHYHMLESTVDRDVDTDQPSAHEGAELEVRRLQVLQRDEERRRAEQLEKARLRGKEALRREHLVLDRQRLLVELEHMQQTDLLRRRQQVSQMPPQIFQPLYKRNETREDFQREMEFAFEDMYTGERRVKGDLVVQLVPEPLPALSTGSQDQELDVTLEEIASLPVENTHHETEQEAGHSERETSIPGKPSKPAPRRALKKLLDRIRSQRTQWTDRHTSEANSPTAIADQIPERDTTIDTGSLTSEEKDKLPHMELIEPSHSPPVLPALETDEPAADTLLPDVLASRIQAFTDGQKKREGELKREKQQQVALLQELEEQKAQLEQMLLEAQQEREYLKAVSQDIPINQVETPVHDQEATSDTCLSNELVPPTAEDDHDQRIREYQQQLLEQNRTHQRSVEVARQHLEEYQRALQIRYSMTTTTLVPTVVPQGLTHQALQSMNPIQLPTSLQLSTQSLHHATPLQIPAPPVDIHAKPLTSREASKMVDSPSRLPIAGSSICSRLLPDSMESFLNNPRHQTPDLSAWLTDSIMERVTNHLPERVRPTSVPTVPLPHIELKTHHSANIPLQPTSDRIQVISPSIIGATLAPGALPHGSLQRQQEEWQRWELDLELEMKQRQQEEQQRRELEEVQGHVLEQKEMLTLQQGWQEEERHRQEVELMQMKQQKETLQALIHTDTQSVPGAASDTVVSDSIGQTRLKLLASLLRAIEETNGGTLSRLKEPQETDAPPRQQQALSNTVLLPPPRAAKPPVTRVRLGVMDMTEQHELSAIEEVETPVNTSCVTGMEESVNLPLPTVDWNLQEESDSSVTSDRALQALSLPSRGQQTAKRLVGTGMSSRSSSNLIWKDRLLMGGRTSSESSESGSIQRIISPVSSDSGRGADYSGPAATSFQATTESALRPADSDCLSTTTISTGSYITTDPEQNIQTDKSSPLKCPVEQEQGADLFTTSSLSEQSTRVEDSTANRQCGVAVASLFNDSSIQHIIDRYTRELNLSLSTTGKIAGSESLNEEPSLSGSQQPLVQVSGRTREDESAARSPPSDAAGAQRRSLQWDNSVSTALQPFAGDDPSLIEVQDQDSFRPLIGQLADESSCLAADHRDSAMEQLVGQPSAHSSMIGQLPGPPFSVSLDHGGWDSTLSRMIGRLSLQSGSQWLSGGRDFFAGQLMGHMTLEHSTLWLEEGPQENQMRPLVGELDEFAGQHSGSSGERTHVDFGVSTEAGVPSYPPLPHEASSPSPSVNPHSQDQNQTSSMDLGPDRTEGLDSFDLLPAEVTNNETADPSMAFHPPDHDVPNSPGHATSWERSVSTLSEEFETHGSPSVSSEPSPECFRAGKSTTCMGTSSTLQESLSQLLTSQHHPQESILMISPTVRTNVEPVALSLSNVICAEVPTLNEPQTDSCIPETYRDSLLLTDLCAEQAADPRTTHHVSEKMLEAASEKGILEQSDITLVSLTDTTQDQETTITDGDGLCPDGLIKKELEGHETEGSESALLPDETPEDKNQMHTVRLLEFPCGPNKDLQEVYQQKQRALLQRSSRRVEEIKAKRALTKIQMKIQAPSEASVLSNAQHSQPISYKAKTKAEAPHKTNTKTEGKLAEQHQNAEKSGSIKQTSLQPPAPVTVRQKRVDEMKICTVEQRKLNISEMRQRTLRLYEQLEEVKQQKTIRSRQEAYAKNRLKAKEFHKKTLQKLRAKQTLQ